VRCPSIDDQSLSCGCWGIYKELIKSGGYKPDKVNHRSIHVRIVNQNKRVQARQSVNHRLLYMCEQSIGTGGCKSGAIVNQNRRVQLRQSMHHRLVYMCE
jgi:hypothetical protein